MLKVAGWAACIGLIAALLLAGFISTWEWIENPGGIFRDENGTNWQFIFDTAWSWFAPTVLPAIVIAAVPLSIRHLLAVSKNKEREDV